MKRMVTMALAAAASLMMATTAFADTDPRDVLDVVAEKNNSLDSMDAQATVLATMYYDGESAELMANMNLKMKDLYSNDMKYIADMQMQAIDPQTGASETANAKVFYEGGYLYEDVMGEKYKMPMDLNSIMQQSKAMSESVKSSEWIKDFAIRQEGENFVMDYTADTDKFNGMLQALLETGSDLTSGIGMRIKNLSGSYVLNKDLYYTDMDMLMDVDITLFGETMTFVMRMDVKVNNPGKPVNFTLPSTSGYELLGGGSGYTGAGAGPAA